MELQHILLLSNTLLLLFLGYLLRLYLPSYFSEKAKLLAQKEDISSITKEIEHVKSEHAKQIKLFEMQQAQLLQGSSELRQSRTQTLLSYFECVVSIIEQELFDGFTQATFSQSNEEVDHYFSKVEKKFVELRQNFYKITVFFRNDHPLLKEAGHVHECSNELHEILRSHYIQIAKCTIARILIQSACIKDNSHLDKLGEKLDDTDVLLNKYFSAIKPEVEKAKRAAHAYLNEVNRYFGAFEVPSL